MRHLALTQKVMYVHCANLSSFSIVPVMPRPISAAFLANSDLAPFLGPFSSPLGDPFAARLCVSVSNDCRCTPTLAEDFLFCACAKTVLNSAVRSCIEVVTIIRKRRDRTGTWTVRWCPALYQGYLLEVGQRVDKEVIRLPPEVSSDWISASSSVRRSPAVGD